MRRTLFYNVQLWDASREFVEEGMHILVEGDRIKEISDKPIKTTETLRINCKGKTIIPGLIDCHCHVVMSSLDIRELQDIP